MHARVLVECRGPRQEVETALARVSGVSEAHFARSFKDAFGVPPHRYLLTRRIERATALLRDTDLSITELMIVALRNALIPRSGAATPWLCRSALDTKTEPRSDSFFSVPSRPLFLLAKGEPGCLSQMMQVYDRLGLEETGTIGRVVVHPSDPDVAWVSAMGPAWSDGEERGVFKTGDGVMLFDFGSAVDVQHPNSKQFLVRDVLNISRFFEKRGIDVPDVALTAEKIKGENK